MIEVSAMRIENAINEVQGPQQAERRQNAEVRRKRGTGRPDIEGKATRRRE